MDLLTPAQLAYGDWQVIYCVVAHRLPTTSDQQSLLQVISPDGEWAISPGVDLCEVQWGMIYDAVQAERVDLELELRDPENPDGDFERLLQVIGPDGEWAISQGVDLCEVQWGMIYDAVQAERVALELELRDPENPDRDFERLHRYAASLHEILGQSIVADRC